MIKKNQDGSYNKFQLAIIILIAAISICIIGALVIQNIEIPKWTPTQPEPIIKNTTIETVPLINDSGKLSWVEVETYPREGGGGGQGSYVTNYNVTYAGSGGNGAYITPANISTNMTYVVVAGGGGSANVRTYINSTQVINNTILETQPTIIQNSNTSQNLTVADSITKVIDVFPNTMWILLIFVFLITASISGNGSGGVIFPIGLIMILWWLNILSLNSIITFIIPAIFIYYIIKMFSSDR